MTCTCTEDQVGEISKEHWPCARLATQEDLLCDLCRDGCNLWSRSLIGATEHLRDRVDFEGRLTIRSRPGTAVLTTSWPLS